MRSCIYKMITLYYFVTIFNNTNAQEWIPIDVDKDTIAFSKEIIESNSSIYKVRFTIHGLYDKLIENNYGRFHHLSLGNNAHLNNIGEPALPLISQLISIPTKGDYSISIEEGKWIEIEMSNIYPAQKPLLEGEYNTTFSMDRNVYSNEYKPSIIHKGTEMDWRGIRNVNVSVCPFIYHPNVDRLSVLSDFILQICFSKSDTQNDETSEDIWGLFDNSLEASGAKSYSFINYDYLIIVGNESILNSQELKDFQRWKAFKGYRTKAVSTMTTSPMPQYLKNYINQEYSNGVRYVLFIGDDDQIPLNNTISATGRSVKSDYWYGCIGGDTDMEADIAIGRFSTNSLDDFRNMINKTIKYEKSYPATNTAILVAHKQDAPGEYQGCCETISNTQYNTPVSFSKLYGASSYDGGTNATNSQICSQINNGAHIVNYRGHGSYNLWPNWNISNEDFVDTQINNINDGTSAVFFSVACHTGNIRNQTCMMETFTRSTHGAVAFLSATEKSYTIANHPYNQYLFQKLFNNGVYQVGDLNIAAHIQNFSICDSLAKDNAFCYLCGGDPTLEIWTDTPQTLSNVQLTSNGNITINPGINNYTISLVSKGGELIQRLLSANNSCTFTPPSADFYIVINKHNYFPYIIYYDTSSNYIQNKTIDYDAYYRNSPIIAGYDATTSETFGDVIIKDGAKMDIKVGSGGVTLKNGFECQIGGSLVVE